MGLTTCSSVPVRGALRSQLFHQPMNSNPCWPLIRRNSWGVNGPSNAVLLQTACTASFFDQQSDFLPKGLVDIVEELAGVADFNGNAVSFHGPAVSSICNPAEIDTPI